MAKRSFKLLALTMAAALALTACGGGSNNGGTDNGGSNTAGTDTQGAGGGSEGTKAEQITITFQNIYPDPTTPTHRVVNKLVEQYMAENPNVKIELDSLNTDQQKVKLKTQAASRELPDITIVNPAAQMQPFVEAGLLAPLNDILDKDGLRDTYLSGLLDYYTFDGNTYALPDGSNLEVVFYNKALFEKAGITKTPETFDELLDIVKKLKDAGITPMTIGEKDTWTGSFNFMNIVLRTNGGPGFLQDVLDGKKTFNDPAFIEAVEAFQKLIDAGAFPEGATSIDYNTAGNMFRTGQTAMYFMGSWETGANEQSEIGSNLGVFKFPTVNGKGDPNEFMLAPGSGFAVSADSEHLEETKAFLHFFASNYPKAQFDEKNAVGLGQKVDGDFKAAGYSDLAIELAALFSQVKGGDLAFDNTMAPPVAQAHLSSIQNMFVSKVDAAQVAAEHQTAFEANK